MKKYFVAVGIAILVVAGVLYFAIKKYNMPYISVVAYNDNGQAIEYRKEYDSNFGIYDLKTTIEVRRGKEILFSKSTDFGDWGFITWEHGEKQCKIQHHQLAEQPVAWQEFLTNPGSNKNRRYLALWNYSMGVSRASNGIYILDTKNDFKLIDELYQEGECWKDEYTFNPKNCSCRGGITDGWIVNKSEAIGPYGGCLGEGHISVDLKIIPGKKPELASVKTPKPDFEKEFLLKERKKFCDECGDIDHGKEIFFAYLYGDMANWGWIDSATEFARKFGFTEADIKKYGNEILNDIRKSKYYPYLVQLNGKEF